MVCIRDSSLKKCAPLRREELIHKDDIDEVLYPLKESDTDYITMSGNVYKYYYDDLYFKKKHYVDNHNGYIYVSITCKDGKNRNYTYVIVEDLEYLERKKEDTQEAKQEEKPQERPPAYKGFDTNEPQKEKTQMPEELRRKISKMF